MKLLTMSKGNRKLTPNKNVKFIIWNLPAIKTCPFAGLCKDICYAMKAERIYPTARKARERNYTDSLLTDFVENAIYTIDSMISKPSYKTAKKIIVRIHESGDFYSREYADKWLTIANHFKGDRRIVFVAYTKSLPFFHGLNIPENFVLRFSLWDDTPGELVEMAEEMDLPTYTAVDGFTTETKLEKCDCKDCGTCLKCFNKKFKRLVVEKH